MTRRSQSRQSVLSLVAGLEDRIPVLIQKYGKIVPGLDAGLIQKINQYDPTGDRAKYTEWLLRYWPRVQQDDVGWVRRGLQRFDRFKNTKKFRDDGYVPDINFYKYEIGTDDRGELEPHSFSRLLSGLIEIEAKIDTEIQKRNQQKAFERDKKQAAEDVETVYREGPWEIKEIDPSGNPDEAELALCGLARGSGWCVKQLESARFYLKHGTMYMIFYNGKPHSLYAPSEEEDQFRDVWNRSLPSGDPARMVFWNFSQHKKTRRRTISRLVVATLADRIPILHQKYRHILPQEYHAAVQEIRYLNQADPTGDRAKYTEWLVRYSEYASLQSRNPVALASVRNQLRIFDRVKPVLKDNGLSPDINDWSFNDLMSHWSDKAKKLRELAEERPVKDTKAIQKGRRDAELVYNEGGWSVYKVDASRGGLDAAVQTLCGLANSSVYCTEEPESASYYLKSGPVYVIFYGNKRKGMYSPSMSQLTDEHNKLVQEYIHPLRTIITNALSQKPKPVTSSIVADLKSKIPLLLKKYGKKYPGLEISDIEWMNMNDPTGDRAEYTEWLLRHRNEFNKTGWQRHAIVHWLGRFNRIKQTRYLKLAGLVPDINRYSFHDIIGQVFQKKLMEAYSLKDKHEINSVVRNGQQGVGVQKVFQHGDWTLWRIESPDESDESINKTVLSLCQLTKGSGWCTKDYIHAEDYIREGPVILVMKGDERCALYSPAMGELRDAMNRPINDDHNPIAELIYEYERSSVLRGRRLEHSI